MQLVQFENTAGLVVYSTHRSDPKVVGRALINLSVQKKCVHLDSQAVKEHLEQTGMSWNLKKFKCNAFAAGIGNNCLISSKEVGKPSKWDTPASYKGEGVLRGGSCEEGMAGGICALIVCVS